MGLAPEKNSFWKAWAIVALATLGVMAFPYLREEWSFLQEFTSPYSIHFLPDAKTDTTQLQVAEVPASVLEDTLIASTVDSAYLDSLDRANYIDSVDAAAAKGLVSFFRQLRKLETDPTEKVTILWFGDSMIEGDMITQDVRDSLQSRFGGMGVGYVPLTSVVNYFRNTIRHEFSDNWSSYSQVGQEEPHLMVNWNGEYFTALHDSAKPIQTLDSLSVTYKGSGAFPGTRLLPRPTLLYGKQQKNDSLYQDTVNTVYYSDSSYTLNDSNSVNRLTLSRDSLYRVALDFQLKPDQPLLGMHFHSGSGIELSNISSRGNSGMMMRAIPADVYRGMSGEKAPALIVLQFGVNASSLGVTEYDWYERAMKRVVNYLQKVYPTTSIVVVSMADRCAKVNGVMQTDSSVFAMNQVLTHVASESEVAYFDLFHKMGGTDSMKEWVEADPSLANKDYTHFNFRGSRKVATYFIEFVMEQYAEFKKEHEEHEEHE